MTTLILSIHIRHAQSHYWRRLQALFIAQTQSAYEYGVIVNGDDPALYQNVIHHIPQLVPHRQAIDVALGLFRQHRHRFDHCLLLDSDCWPVRPDWQDILTRLVVDPYQYAAPLRAENYDNFPHPCAFFMRSAFVPYADFDFKRSTNLLGVEVADVGAAMPQRWQEQQIWYPLIKSNRVVPHPIYASIYGDLFYHHCAGSRGPGFRANSYHCYDHMIQPRQHRKIYHSITLQLWNRPQQFIGHLRGKGST